MDTLILLGSFTLLCALGVPVAYALGLGALLGALWYDIPLEAVMLRISDGTDDFVLLAIPFFVLAGGIMAEGGMAARLHEERDRQQHEVVGAVGDAQHHRLEQIGRASCRERV